MAIKISLFKEGSWVFAGQIVQLFGGLFFIRTMTELLNPVEYGKFSLFLTFTTLIEIALLGGLRGATTRFYSVAREEQKGSWFIGTVFFISVCLSLFILVAGLAIAAWIVTKGDQSLGLAILTVALISAISTIAGCCSALQSGARRQAIVSTHNAVSFWLRSLVALLIVPHASNGYLGALYSVAAASTLIFLSQLMFLLRNEQMRLCRDEFMNWGRRAFLFALPYSSWGIFSWMQQVADRWLLEFFADTADVGIYTALFQSIYGPAILVGTTLISFITPIVYHIIGDAKDQVRIRQAATKTRKLSQLIMVITMLVAAASVPLHGKIASLIIAPSYRSHSELIPWFVLAGGLMAAYHMVGSIVPALMKTSSVVLPVVILGTCSLLLMFFGVRFMGLQGVVLALVASSSLHLVTMWVLSDRLVSRSIITNQ